MRFLTAGESHGEAVVAVVEGFPKGVTIDSRLINRELTRRMSGYGRGKRMKIESDTVRILSGLRNRKTLGSPVTLVVYNKDHRVFSQKKDTLAPLTLPRPGHADLAGFLKYGEKDIRNILERSSARSTVAMVCVGALCRQFLSCFKITVASHVTSIGRVAIKKSPKGISQIQRAAMRSSLCCIDQAAERAMKDEIDRAREQGDTLGGIVEIWVKGVPPGLGSPMHFDRRLDARIGALMGMPAVKGVEIGAGFSYAGLPGSMSHDPITFSRQEGFSRPTNNSGGIEGGISTGEPILVRIALKPIPTLKAPLPSVDIRSKKVKKAHIIRSDTCVVPAAGVIAENSVSIILMECMLEKFGSDTLHEIRSAYQSYISSLP